MIYVNAVLKIANKHAAVIQMLVNAMKSALAATAVQTLVVAKIDYHLCQSLTEVNSFHLSSFLISHIRYAE